MGFAALTPTYEKAPELAIVVWQGFDRNRGRDGRFYMYASDCACRSGRPGRDKALSDDPALVGEQRCGMEPPEQYLALLFSVPPCRTGT